MLVPICSYIDGHKQTETQGKRERQHTNNEHIQQNREGGHEGVRSVSVLEIELAFRVARMGRVCPCLEIPGHECMTQACLMLRNTGTMELRHELIDVRYMACLLFLGPCLSLVHPDCRTSMHDCSLELC